MSRKPEFRILLVEDEVEWRMALDDAYRKLLAPHYRVSIDPVATGPEALTKLQHAARSPFDLLSVDINLGLGHPVSDGRPNLKIEGADGRTLIRKANEWSACRGLLVITGIHRDDTLRLVLPSDSEVSRVRTTLAAYLQKLFPGRHLLYFKAEGVTPAVFIKTWGMSAADLRSVCASPLGQFSAPLELDFDGDETAGGRVVVRSTKDRTMQKVVIRQDDQRFLIALAKWTPVNGYVGFDAVLAIFDGSLADPDEDQTDLKRRAHSRVNSVRRRLLPEVDPDDLFTSVARKGWRLRGSVRTVGNTDANPYGGGQDPDSMRFESDE